MDFFQNFPVSSTTALPVIVGAITNLVAPFFLSIPLWVVFYTSISKNNDYRKARDLGELSPTANNVFDFVIVGGGSAGAVLANRLSKHSTVLLLELGGDPNPLSKLGLSFYLLQRCPGTDLLYETVPQKNAALGNYNQRVFWPRGTGIGGSSNLNAMIYQRGNRNDYNRWANITGNNEWAFSNVLNYFKKLEDYEGSFPSGKYHGKGGPMHVEKIKQSYLQNYILEAAREKGYPTKDPNGFQTIGFTPLEVTQKNGLRWSTYPGYIQPIEKTRKNLKIYRYSRVVKVHMDKNKHAYGVTFFRHGLYHFVRAKKEIILSAGAIDTPKIMMLSGIGPKRHLNSVGIKCRANLPVGQNLQDHVMSVVGPFLVDVPEKESVKISNFIRVHNIYDFYSESRSGILSSTLQNAVGFVSTSVNKYDKYWPDMQYTSATVPLTKDNAFSQLLKNLFNFKTEILEEYIKDYKDQEKDAYTIIMALQKPKSIGEIKLANKNPFSDALMDPKYYSHPDDIKAMTEGFKILVDIFENTTTYRNLNGRLIERKLPGCEKFVHKTDGYFECYLRHFTTTIYHPVGTAAMGKNLKDKRAVVDPELRVFKTSGLRVIDASIMPIIVNANTNVPTIMIAELGSDFIRRYWQAQYLVSPYLESVFLKNITLSQCYYSKIM